MPFLTALFKTYARAPHQVLRNISWRRSCSISDQSVVFVVGAPRSGTTLLQRVLASHSDLFSLEGETAIFSARNIFARDHFGLSHDKNLELFRASKDIVDFFSRGIKALRAKRGGGMFVEKTPQHVRRLAFLTRHFPDSKFIHIVRDGRDCFCSSRGHPNIPLRSPASFARYWRDCIRAADSVDKADQVLTIRYEDLTADAPKVMERVMAHIGLELEPGQLDPSQTGQDLRADLEHFKRIASPISAATVGRWHKDLSPGEVEAFDRVAADELQLHGYALQQDQTG